MSEKDDGRLFARIDPPVNRRLRVFATLRGLSLADTLSSVLDQHLPSDAELAAEVANGGTPDDHAA